MTKIQIIFRELLKLAKAPNLSTAARFPNYLAFGKPLGYHDLRGTRLLLDRISKHCIKRKKPDVTFLLRNKRTGLPSVIKGADIRGRPATASELHYLRTETQKLVEKYFSGGKHPY
ncbi:MAG TPA: hypothetical protein VFI93_05215 [Rhizomicrobium sp.]|nr:hypothetical protein [Rhizomicrobium sp.]